MEIENYRYRTWRLDDSLCGFGVVVSSANNGAVENISKELPGIGAIDEDLELDYFSAVADTIRVKGGKRPETPKCWGLVSAALGNSKNRSAFIHSFWFEGRDKKERELAQEPDPLRPVSLPVWIEQNQALAPSWQDAREQYMQARQRVQDLLDNAAKLADILPQYTQGASRFKILSQQFSEHAENLTQLETQRNQAASYLRETQNRYQAAARCMKALKFGMNCSPPLAG